MFAGASKELLEALIVNPYDAAMMGDALLQALTMSQEEQSQRMRRMREIVRDNNVYRWAAACFSDAARLAQAHSGRSCRQRRSSGSWQCDIIARSQTGGGAVMSILPNLPRTHRCRKGHGACSSISMARFSNMPRIPTRWS